MTDIPADTWVQGREPEPNPEPDKIPPWQDFHADLDDEGPVTTLPPGGVEGQHLTKKSNADWDVEWTDPETSPPAGGDVTGPISAVNDNLVSFDGATGKIIRDSGFKAADFLLRTGGVMTGQITLPGGGTGLQAVTRAELDAAISSGFVLADGAVTTPKLADDAVTLDKLQNITGPAFLGRQAATSGNAEAMTGAQATALLDPFTGALKGLVPSPGGTDGRFLRDDGSWAVVPVAMVKSVQTLGTLTDLDLPAVDGETVIYCGSYWNDNARGGGFFRLNSLASTADSWRVGFLVVLDYIGRKWERLIEPQGIDFHMTGARADGSIGAGSGAVSGTDNTERINRIADYLIAATIGNADVVPVKVSGGGGIFACDGPVDFAKVGDGSCKWYLDLTGTCIASRAQGAEGEVAFDLTGCEGCHINGGIIYGDPTTIPAVGWFTCRIGGTSDDMRFDRPMAIGEFMYAAGHNSGGENVHWEQAYMNNSYMGPCYGFAQDSLTYLRYDPPVACTCTATNPMKVTRTGTAHGMADGWFVYMGTRGDDGRRYPITPDGGDPNSFTIPYDNTLNDFSVKTKYFRARYWSKSDRVLATNDIILPYTGDGAFTGNYNGGEALAPYGIAGLLDTPGGRRKINCRVSATVYEDPAYGAARLITGTTAPNVINVTHGLPVAAPATWPPLLIWFKAGAGSSISTSPYRVMSVPNATSLTVARVDGTAVAFPTAGAFSSTIIKLNNYGAYGIHWLLTDRFETPLYESVHMEAGPGKDIAHGTMCHIYIQSIEPMRTPTWTAAVQVSVKGARFAEHTAHSDMALMIVDTRTISQLRWAGEIRVADFSGYNGGDTGPEGTGKVFRAHNGTSFVSPTAWRIRGALYLEKGAAALNPVIDYQGDYINTLSGENMSRRRGSYTHDVAATGATDTVAHGLHKTPAYVNARILGGSVNYADIISVDATDMSIRIKKVLDGSNETTGSFTVIWEAVV